MEKYFFEHTQKFPLETGGHLPSLTVAYCTFGKMNEDQSNVIWVCHALTGGADVTAWWEGLFGEGRYFNPEEHFVICANVLGSCYGTTGPLSINPETSEPYCHDFPKITVRDMVNATELLRKHLDIKRINTLIGGSLGGQQALEWAIQQPDLFENLILVCTNAKHSPWGIAFNETQRMAIKSDPTWHKGGVDAGKQGMVAARAVAMLSYRNYETYEATQSETDSNKLGDFRASSYQQYQGEKLAKRFNAYAYWVLSEAMDSHNIGRGKESVTQALQKIEAYTLVIGINTDVLFPILEQRFMTRWISNVTYEEINSHYGHDGFLVETDQLEKSFRAFYRQKKRKLLHQEQDRRPTPKSAAG